MTNVLFCPVTFNLAETTRMIQVARALDPIHHPVFMGYEHDFVSLITDAGFGPDYKVPGLPHRTGHGIGLDGHEWTNFVRGNTTPLAPGMCFSNEPMIAIYGEFGIRLEDHMLITETGASWFTQPAHSVDDPFGVDVT